MNSLNANPFIAGRAVRGKEFFNRTQELGRVFGRLLNGESTALVGEPHIGKTSFLLQIADKKVQQEFFGNENSPSFITSQIDAFSLPADSDPEKFWDQALSPLADITDDSDIRNAYQNTLIHHFDNRSLIRLFRIIHNRGKLLVLLLDEFECLLAHPNFKDHSFYALIRSIATQVGGLALVTSSRMKLGDLNHKGRSFLDLGSPLFNYMIEERLSPFDNCAIQQLLMQASPVFSDEEILFIRRMAGRNPFLLQAMAAAVYNEPEGKDRLPFAAKRFYDQIAWHFEDVWNTLDEKAKTVAVILCLKELDGRAAGSEYNYGEIERVDFFERELQQLSALGLAEQIEKTKKEWLWDSDHWLIWRGEKWGISAEAFTWWISEVAIASIRSVPAFDEWLQNQRYIGFLTRKQWDYLQKAIVRSPVWVTRSIFDIGRMVLEELRKAR